MRAVTALLLVGLPGLVGAEEVFAHSDLGQTLALVVVIGMAIAVPLVILLLSRLLGPPVAGAAQKGMPIESGLPSGATIGDAGQRFSVKFYLIAMLFLVFDVEVAFLYPFAVVFMDGAGWSLMLILIVFLVLLEAAYLYLWQKGALDWER